MLSYKELIAKFAGEQKKCIHELVKNNKVDSEKVEKILSKIEKLTEIELENNRLTMGSIDCLGLENCCNYFKSLCEQYVIYSNRINASAKEDASKYEMNINLSIDDENSINTTICLGDSAEIINSLIELEYQKNKENNPNHIDSDRYIMAKAEVFNKIHDDISAAVVAKSFYNGFRELSTEESTLGEGMVEKIAVSKKTTVDEVKEQLSKTLNDGIDAVYNAPKIQVELKKGEYFNYGDKYFVEFSYANKEQQNYIYQLIYKNVVPHYGVNSSRYSEGKDCLMPYFVDENNQISSYDTGKLGGTTIPEDLLMEFIRRFVEVDDATVKIGDFKIRDKFNYEQVEQIISSLNKQQTK